MSIYPLRRNYYIIEIIIYLPHVKYDPVATERQCKITRTGIGVLDKKVMVLFIDGNILLETLITVGTRYCMAKTKLNSCTI